MTRPASRSLSRILVLGAVVLAAVAGCSKKATAPLPQPEGQQNGSILLMGWHEQPSVSFVLDDPGTPENTLDDVLASVTRDFWADSNGVRTTALDFSVANQMQAYSVGGDGNAHPLFDFLLQPEVRFIGKGVDVFTFEDFRPAAKPRYFERGAVNGQVTTASPVSNPATAGPFKEDMQWLMPPTLAAGDSTLKISYADDPRTVFSVLQVAEATPVLGSGSTFSAERRLRGVASATLPGQRSLATFTTIVVPAGFGNPGLRIPLTSRRWPLFFYFRVTGFDASGQMVNRVNDYLTTQSSDGGHTFSAYEPLGGAVQVLDPYPDRIHPVPVPVQITHDRAMQILHIFGGDARQANMSYLGGQAAGAMMSVATAAPGIAAQIQANPACSAAALRDRIARIQRSIDAAASPAPAIRQSSILRQP